MDTKPIVLVPGFWLGAWAWDEVAEMLRAGGPGYVVTDRMPDRIAHMVYVDTGAATEAANEERDGDLPMPSLEDLRKNEPLDGLSDEQLATFAERAVPEPAGAVRDTPLVTNEARKAVPSTVIATGYPAVEYQKGVEQGWGFIAGLADLTDLTWVDLPTSHWPMWSRPRELADLLGGIARAHPAPDRPN